MQHVLAGDAHVGGAVLHIGRHIGSAHDDQTHVVAVGADDQLARRFRIFGRHDAGRRQQRQGFLEDAALGQGESDHAFSHPDARAQAGHVGALDVQPFVAAIEMVDALDQRLALRHQAGDDQAGRGAQSVAITVAPSSFGTPLTKAVLPSILMSAPRRISSTACMKRFSKMVSRIIAVPSATALMAMNWACMSVGKAG
jgi:hypothetical protein